MIGGWSDSSCLFIFSWFSDLLNSNLWEKKECCYVYILFENIIKIDVKCCVRGHSSDTFLKINSIETNKRQLINNIFLHLFILHSREASLLFSIEIDVFVFIFLLTNTTHLEFKSYTMFHGKMLLTDW